MVTLRALRRVISRLLFRRLVISREDAAWSEPHALGVQWPAPQTWPVPDRRYRFVQGPGAQRSKNSNARFGHPLNSSRRSCKGSHVRIQYIQASLASGAVARTCLFASAYGFLHGALETSTPCDPWNRRQQHP